MRFSFFFFLTLFLVLEEVASDRIVKMFAGRPDIFPPVCGFKPDACEKNQKYRRLDASCTNPNVPHWGVAGDLYMYLLRPPQYQDGVEQIKQFIGPFELPSARELRLDNFPDGNAPSSEHTLLFMTFGQFIAHDHSMLVERDVDRCCTPSGRYQPKMSRSCIAIQIRRNDPVYSTQHMRCMNYTRAESDLNIGCPVNKYASPFNTVTSPLDLSLIYGNSKNENAVLRSFSGGLLQTRLRNGVELLPKTTTQTPPCEFDYQTGDTRSNQNLPLLVTQILFYREHNRIAKKLTEINPLWDDERLFYEARKILIAQYQHIVYYEWLPIFLNKTRLYQRKIIYDSKDYVEDFDPNASPAISVEYAHAASRRFHSAIPDNIELYDKNRKLFKSISFSKNFNCQEILEEENIIQGVFMGLITQIMAELDKYQSKSVGEGFEVPFGKVLGRDLISLDIQRGRDMALNSYVKYKKAFGLGNARRFEDLTDLINPEDVKILKESYEKVEMIDLIVGGMLETHVLESYLGPTLHTIAEEQFLRIRRSDYRFYESKNGGFTLAQLNNIRTVSRIGKLFCNSGDVITDVQENPFDFPTDDENKIGPCSSLPDLDWSLWKE